MGWVDCLSWSADHFESNSLYTFQWTDENLDRRTRDLLAWLIKMFEFENADQYSFNDSERFEDVSTNISNHSLSKNMRIHHRFSPRMTLFVPWYRIRMPWWPTGEDGKSQWTNSLKIDGIPVEIRPCRRLAMWLTKDQVWSRKSKMESERLRVTPNILQKAQSVPWQSWQPGRWH